MRQGSIGGAPVSPNATGAYSLRLRGNALRPISYGATLNGSLTPDDVQTAAGDYLDTFFFTGVQGETARLRLTATAFDPLLLLNRNSGTPVATDDNGGGGAAAQIRQVLPGTGVYVVLVTPFAPGRTGDYTLALTRNPSSAADNPLAERLVAPDAPSRMAAHESVNEEAAMAFEQYAARRVRARD